jgi:hypothetical protein
VQDPEYPVKVGPDEQKFLDPSTSMVTVGWEEAYVLDGKVVNFTEDGRSAYAENVSLRLQGLDQVG